MLPHECVEIVLAHGPVLTHAAVDEALGVGSEASVVVQRAARRLRGGARKAVATLFADREALEQRGDLRAPRREAPVILELSLRLGEAILGDDRGHRDLEPFGARPAACGAPTASAR